MATLYVSYYYDTATLFQTVVIATGQYQPQVVRMPPAREGVESGCNNIIRVLHIRKGKDCSEVKKKNFLILPTRDSK
jgi:hypothetical protein